jgi:hypothetical protein
MAVPAAILTIVKTVSARSGRVVREFLREAGIGRALLCFVVPLAIGAPRQVLESKVTVSKPPVSYGRGLGFGCLRFHHEIRSLLA